MPYRIIPFVSGYFYHIFNRGTEKRSIFENNRDRSRFLRTIQYYQYQGPKPRFSKFLRSNLNKFNPNKKIVEIVSYCLMPNHFHLLIKQLKDGGISEFMSKFSNSYTKFFNTKYQRVGALLQGQFKAVLVENDEQLIHLTRYIHLNPLASFLVKELGQYQWSSYHEYINTTQNGICSKEEVSSFFKSPKKYEEFVLDQVDYAQKLELIKHQLIDNEI